MGPPLLMAEHKQIRVQIAIELLQVLSMQSKTRASGTTLSPWTSCVFICSVSISEHQWASVSISEHDLMWTALGEIVVDRERHIIQSPKFMLTVVWNPIGIHVPCSMFSVLCSESPPERAQIQCTILYYYTNDILVAISDWRRQTGETRPNKLWVHSDNARSHTAKMSRDYIVSIE
jgi:hypothetical protein